MTDTYFATGYVRLLFRLVRAEQVTSARLLEGTGCSEADLMRADFEMPFAQQMRLCSNALAATEPGLGLRVGYQLQLASHGALGTALQSAPNLGAALHTFAQYIGARASFFGVELLQSDASLQVVIQVRELPAGLVPFFSESILFTLTHCLTFYLGTQARTGNIELAYPKPSYAGSYAAAFSEPSRFDCATTGIDFDPALLALPSPEADARVYAESLKRCEDQINRRLPKDDVALTIESFLLDNPGKLWTLEDVAPLVAMSPRTLLRRLKRQGTSYQQLRDGVLKDRAKVYLSSMSVEAAAMSLGFADSSSFRRTCKRWFAKLPSEVARTQGQTNQQER